MMRTMNFSFALLSVLNFFTGYTFSQVTSIPYDPSPYAAVGYITGATLDNSSDILSGGTLSINNIDIIIPRNLLVNTPSLTAVAWSELFNEDGTIDLPLWPEISWEAQVFANYIGGQYIAGIVYILQEIANLNEGFITAIDYEKGEFRVGGDFADPTTGVRVVINDPVGRFGKVHGDWPLWTADTDNPSIQASTGFPLCLPRADPAVADDPLCPDTNRPVDTSGKPLSEFTFAAPPVPAGQPDPNLFVPLKVGDFIIYSGTIVEDTDGRLIAAYSIEGNLGIYTTPGTIPAYLRIETQQAGINGDPAGEIQETRVEGYTTDETATIQIFTIDVDPCTGEETERSWGTAVPRALDRKGQWRFRSRSTALPPYTREVGVRVTGGTVATPNGILGGQFISPYPPDGYIFPELIVFGDPQIPHEFNLMPHLASGSGPWLGGIPGVPQTATGPIVGQLNPWPGVGSPAIQNCPVINPLVPVASAGFDATVVSGANVTLFGGVKNDIDVTNLTFSWLQTSGVTVELANANSINATFLAPAVSTVSTLVFTLTVSNDAGESSDQVVININPGPTVDSIIVEEASWKSGKGSGTLTVIASTNVISSQLFVSATDPDVDTIAMTSLGSGRFQALVSIRPSPVLVTITSSLGASVTVSVSN